MTPYKFNVNDAVVILAAKAPFEYCCVSEQLENGDQRSYRIRSGPNERLVQESDLIRLTDRLNSLLTSAEADRNEETRNRLLLALHEAQHFEDRRNRPLAPTKLVADIEKSVSKTLDLLEKLKGYRGPDIPWSFDFTAPRPPTVVSDDIGFQAHHIGAGVVDVMPLPKPGTFEAFSEPINGVVGIRMVELLRAWHQWMKGMPKTTPSRPKDSKTTEIVRCAATFFDRYSRKKLSKGNPFRKFVTEFHEWVAGKKPYGGLSGHIEKVLNEVSSVKRSKTISSGKSLKSSHLKATQV